MAKDTFLYGVRTSRKVSAGLDGLTPLLLVAYVLAVIGGGIYMHLQLTELIEQKRVAETFSPGVLWTMIIAGVVLLFAVVGPMVLLGVFIASKIMKFPLSGAAYLKACGVATVPGLLLGLAKLLPPNFVLILFVMVAIVPLAYFVLKSVFELNFGEGAVSFVIAGITGVIGFFISGFIIGALGVGGVVSNQMAAKSGGTNIPTVTLPGTTARPSLSSPTSPHVTNTIPAPTLSPADSVRDALSRALTSTADTSREARERELATLKVQVEQAGATTDAGIAKLIAELEARASAAPSEQPAPAIFEPPAAAAPWKPTDAQLAPRRRGVVQGIQPSHPERL